MSPCPPKRGRQPRRRSVDGTGPPDAQLRSHPPSRRHHLPMNSRILKKHHSRHLSDAVGDISVDGFWRARLFEANYFLEFPIDYDHRSELPEPLRRWVVGKRLRYSVCRIPPQTSKSFSPSEYPGCEIFAFRSVQHGLYAESANNPDVVWPSRRRPPTS